MDDRGSLKPYDPAFVDAIARAGAVTAEEFAEALREIHRVGMQVGDALAADIRALAEPAE